MTFGRFVGSRNMILSWHGGVTIQDLGKYLLKSWKGNVPWVESPGKLRERLWDSFPKVSLGFRRGFKILPENGAKILSYKL
jgi:hypothetical protein